MPYKNIAPLSNQLTIIVGLCVVGAMAFGLALSYYKNILFDEELKDQRGQNEKLRDEINAGYKQLEYLQSQQYKDKYAKEQLNRLNEGEKVIIIAHNDVPILNEAGEIDIELQKEAKYDQLLRSIPVFEHWQMYLFNRNAIEDLKKSL